MNNTVMDAEYESIRDIFNRRGTGGDQLPGKVVRFIPEERADRVLTLDDRIQAIRAAAPWILTGVVALLSFLAGTML